MLKAKDMMSTNIISVPIKTTVLEALKIMVENNVTGLPVVRDNSSSSLVGIVCEKDFLNLLYGTHNWESETIDAIMTANPVCVDEDATAREVCDCLQANVFRRIPVVSNKKLVGIISRRDIVTFMCKRLQRVGNLGSLLEQP